MSQVDEFEVTCDKAPMVIEKFNMEESSPKKKIQASSHPNKDVIVALLIVTLFVMVGVLILAVTGLTIAFAQENAKLRYEISKLEREQTWNFSTAAEQMSSSFGQLNSSFNQQLRAEIDSVQSRFLNGRQVVHDAILQLNQTVFALEERSSLMLEAVARDQRDNLNDVIIRLDSLNASVGENYLQVNEIVTSHQQDSILMLEALSHEMTNLVNASQVETLQLVNDTVALFQENATMKFNTISRKFENLNFSVTDNYEHFNEVITALGRNYEAKFENISDEQNKSFHAIASSIFSLKSSVDSLFYEHNTSFSQLLRDEIEDVESALLQQLIHSQELNASLNRIDLHFGQSVVALEEGYDQKLVAIESQMRGNFTSVAEDISNLTILSNENYDTFIEMVTELEERIDLSLSENYGQLNMTISMIEETTKIKFDNVSAKLEQDVTTTAVSIVNLNSSVHTLFQQLQLSSNEIETIHSVLVDDTQALNASLALRSSQLSHLIALLQEKMEDQVNVTQALNASLALQSLQLSHMIAMLQEKMEDQANDTQALNSSLTSKSLQLNHMIAMLQEKTEEEVRNVSFSLDEVYLELSETISELNDAFENSFGDLEHSFAGLNSSVDDLFQKSVLTAATTQDLNSSFTRLIGDQLQSIYQEQQNEGKKLNISVNQKYSELSQTIVALEETTNANLKNISEEQDYDIKIISDRIKNLNSSVTLLFQNLAIESRLENLNASFIRLLNQQMQTILLRQLNETQKLNATVHTSYSNISQTITQLQNSLKMTGLLPNYPAMSCSSLTPSSPSGYYWIQNSTGSAVRVYCDMTRSCGGVTGGWVRIAHLDMTDSSQQCPSGLKVRNDSNRRTCVKNTDPAGCASVQYPTSNIQYSRVCGKVIGYQVGTPNAFYRESTVTISSAYVDGVSLTHGSSKGHIWTFAAALGEENVHSTSSCHCINSDAPSPPSFVGSDYFCDTGLHMYEETHPGFLGGDPLWDGHGCESPSTCCSFNSPPWFYKQLSHTTDDIEMRVCRKQDADNEDIAIESVEIYIQ